MNKCTCNTLLQVFICNNLRILHEFPKKEILFPIKIGEMSRTSIIQVLKKENFTSLILTGIILFALNHEQNDESILYDVIC